MNIAVNLTCLISDTNKEFCSGVFEKLAAEKPEHQFIFIHHRYKAASASVYGNILNLYSAPRADTLFFWNIWYNYTLPAILKKYKTDLVIHADGSCVRHSKIKQCLFINELYVTDLTAFLSKKQVHFHQKNAITFLAKAGIVFAGTAAQEKKLLERFPVDGTKIRIIQPGRHNVYQPSGLMVRENTKALYAEGKEYFLFSGAVHPRSNLINLLKAFSLFKKRQKSNMLLLIVYSRGTATVQFTESLQTYKYRDEVKLYQDLPETEVSKILAAAYAFVYPAAHECFPLPPARAMACEVPLVLDKSLSEIAGDAALYMDAQDPKEIADKMMLLFKDEQLRSELIKTASDMALEYRKASAENTLWNYITG